MIGAGYFKLVVPFHVFTDPSVRRYAHEIACRISVLIHNFYPLFG